VKALLARIESQFLLSRASQCNVAQIDHFLKQLSSGQKRIASTGNRASKMTVSQVSGKGITRGPWIESRHAFLVAGKALCRFTQ
jgi:hypothetical protein